MHYRDLTTVKGVLGTSHFAVQKNTISLWKNLCSAQLCFILTQRTGILIKIDLNCVEHKSVITGYLYLDLWLVITMSYCVACAVGLFLFNKVSLHALCGRL